MQDDIRRLEAEIRRLERHLNWHAGLEFAPLDEPHPRPNFNVIPSNQQGTITAVIASGVITATHSLMRVDVESSTTDDLDTVLLPDGRYGTKLYLFAVDDGRTVVVKNGTGNLNLAGSDCSLDNTLDNIQLMFVSQSVGWVKISRANNGA